MKLLKDNLGPILMALAQLVVGIILLSKPEDLTTLVIMIVGILLMVAGLGSVIRYFRTEAEEAATGQELSKGLCMVAGGAFCAFRAGWFMETFAVLAMLYGVVILATGISKVQWTVDMLRLKKPKWYFAAIGAALTIVCGVLVVLNPFKTANALWIFLGIALIVEAVVDGVALVFRLKDTPEAAEEPEEAVAK